MTGRILRISASRFRTILIIFARVVAAGIPHHVTQRGNARQYILNSDAERLVYRQLLQQACHLQHAALLGYCLMSSHVHLIVVPARPDALALALKYAHGRYAAYFNASHASSGHVWQGRYYSCPLDPPHLWAAMRYAELNPVRAGLVSHPHEYLWSSAALHCGMTSHDGFVDLTCWREAWNSTTWREYLGADAGDSDAEEIRRSTHTSRPLGSPDFVSSLERALKRRLAPESGGRPRKQPKGDRQIEFDFLISRCSRRGYSGNVPSVPECLLLLANRWAQQDATTFPVSWQNSPAACGFNGFPGGNRRFPLQA